MTTFKGALSYLIAKAKTAISRVTPGFATARNTSHPLLTHLPAVVKVTAGYLCPQRVKVAQE